MLHDYGLGGKDCRTTDSKSYFFKLHLEKIIGIINIIICKQFEAGRESNQQDSQELKSFLCGCIVLARKILACKNLSLFIQIHFERESNMQYLLSNHHCISKIFVVARQYNDLTM